MSLRTYLRRLPWYLGPTLLAIFLWKVAHLGEWEAWGGVYGPYLAAALAIDHYRRRRRRAPRVVPCPPQCRIRAEHWHVPPESL